MRRIVLSLTVVLTATIIGASARAGVVFDSEPNNSIATAQDVDGSFTTDFVPFIQNAIGTNISTTAPHVTFVGFGSSPVPDYDYFRFTVDDAGTVGIFDVDSFNASDTELYLFDAAGTLLAENDNSTTADIGSPTLLDPFLEYTFAVAGVYVLGIGGIGSAAIDGGITGPGVLPGDFYLVHASLSTVPEPATMILFGAGAAGLVYSRRRRRSTDVEDSAPAASADA